MEFTNQTGVDIILDPVGGAMAETNAEILGRDGTWVLYGLLGGGSGGVSIWFNMIRPIREWHQFETLSSQFQFFQQNSS